MKEDPSGRNPIHPRATAETPERSTASREDGAPPCSVASAGAVGGPPPRPLAPPRLRTADRQRILPLMTLDQLIEADHPARAVWRFVEGLDLALLYERVRSRVNTPGRPASDPRVFVALWLYAILYGVISARRLEELSIHHNA